MIPRWTPGGDPPGRVLVVQFRGVGDVVLTTPLLDAMAVAWPEAAIHLWTGSLTAPLFREDPRVTSILERGSDLGIPAAVASLRHARFDLVLDPQSVFLTALAARLSGGYAVGFRRRIRGRWYHRAAALEDHGGSGYAADHKLDLLRLLGVDCALVRPRLAGARSPAPVKSPRILVAPGSPVPDKRWRIPELESACRAIVEATGGSIELAAGPGEEQALEKLARCLPHRRPTHAPRDLDSWRTLLGEADLLLGNDGGIRHLAQALGVPTVGWFGLRNPAPWSFPHSRRDAVLVTQPREDRGILEYPATPAGAAMAARKVLAGGGDQDGSRP